MSLKKTQIKTFLDKILIPNKVFIALFLILNFVILYNTYLTKNRINEYFRIHVVANSDKIYDQILKYEVADEVDEYISSLIGPNTYSKEQSKIIIEENIDKILNLSKQIITEKGFDYEVYANIGKIYYDEKTKDDVHMEEGIYDSLEIIIGEGNGQNWWSLLYPYAYDSYVEIDDKKTDDTNSISTNELISSENVTYKFGIFEFISKLFK